MAAVGRSQPCTPASPVPTVPSSHWMRSRHQRSIRNVSIFSIRVGARLPRRAGHRPTIAGPARPPCRRLVRQNRNPPLHGHQLRRVLGARPVGNRSGRAVAARQRRHTMPTVHPAAPESARSHALDRRGRGPGDATEIRQLTQARRESPGRWRVHPAEDEIGWRNGAEALDLRPGDRRRSLMRTVPPGWVVCQSKRLLDHQRLSSADHRPGDFPGGRTDRRLGAARFTHEATPVEGGYRITWEMAVHEAAARTPPGSARISGWGTKTKTFLFPKSRRHVPRHLAHAGAARHGQQRVFRRRSVHSRTSAPSIATVRATAATTARFTASPARSSIRSGSEAWPWHCPRHDGRVPGPAARRPAAARASRWRRTTSSRATWRSAGEVAVGALFPSRGGGRSV